MDKIILAALLREWQDKLLNAIEEIDSLPPLKDGRQKIVVGDLPNVADLWSVKVSINNLIDALEKEQNA